jgi:ribosomal protein S4E
VGSDRRGGLEITCVHQPLVCADDINILGGNLHTIKKNTALVVASKEISQEVNADENKDMIMSQGQNAGQIHNIQTDSKSLKRWNILNVWKQP